MKNLSLEQAGLFLFLEGMIPGAMILIITLVMLPARPSI